MNSPIWSVGFKFSSHVLWFRSLHSTKCLNHRVLTYKTGIRHTINAYKLVSREMEVKMSLIPCQTCSSRAKPTSQRNKHTATPKWEKGKKERKTTKQTRILYQNTFASLNWRWVKVWGVKTTLPTEIILFCGSSSCKK